MERDQAHRTNELLERIAKALEKNNTLPCDKIDSAELDNFRGIPGFENTLKDLHDLKLHTDEGPDSSYDDDIHNDYLSDLVKDMNQIEYSNFHRDLSLSFAQDDAVSMTNFIYSLEYEECLGAIKSALLITGDSDYVKAVECSEFDMERKDELAKEYVENILKHQSDDYDVDNCDDDCPCKNELASDFHKDFEDNRPQNTPEYEDYQNKLNLEPTSDNPDPYSYGIEERIEDGLIDDEGENNLQVVEYHCGVRYDSDFDIRKTASYYEDEVLANGGTKKDCILDYVTNEFGILGARYTDIIKFAYYLGAPNAPKYTSENRGYYSLAFSKGQGGYLIKGGKDCLVKGINNEGNERYFAFSFVEQATDYWKYVDDRSAR